MFPDFSLAEMELLQAYDTLRRDGRRTLEDYLSYLLRKQYKVEMMEAVIYDPGLYNLLLRLHRLIQRNEFSLPELNALVRQLKDLYFSNFERVHSKYAALVEGLDSCELVRDFGRTGFEHLERAIRTEDRKQITVEVDEFYQSFGALAGKKKQVRLAVV